MIFPYLKIRLTRISESLDFNKINTRQWKYDQLK